MKIDIFILGALNEKSLNLKKLLEYADYIKINRWMNFNREEFVQRIEILNNLNFIEIDNTQAFPIEKANFLLTPLGKKHYSDKLTEYLYAKEINLSMLILFITFSNHIAREEIFTIVEKRIEILKSSVENISNHSKETYLSFLYNHSLRACELFIKSEIQSLESFINYGKNSDWKDFLTYSI